MVRAWVGGLLFTLAAPVAAQPVTLRQTIELIDLSSIAISPDERFVVYRQEQPSIDRNTVDLAWYVVPLDGSRPPRRIADAGAGKWADGTLLSSPPSWSADSLAIYYAAAHGGDVQIWRTGVADGVSKAITSDAGNVGAFAIDWTGGVLTYAAGAPRADILRAEQDELDDGILIDGRVDPGRQLFRGSLLDGRLAGDRLTGPWFQHGMLLSDRPASYRTLLLSDLSVRPASDAEEARLMPPLKPFERFGDKAILARSPSGDARGTAYVLAAGTNATIAVVPASAPGGPARTCRSGPCGAQGIAQVSWAGSSDRLVFTTSKPNTSQSLFEWDIGRDRVRPVKSSDGRLNGGRDDTTGCAVSVRYAVCIAAAADRPPMLERIDLSTGKGLVLSDPNAVLGNASGPKFTPLHWTDAAGHAFYGQLLLPNDRVAPGPLFITYYACDGYLRGGTGDEFPLRQLAQSGIAALCINRARAAPGPGDQVDQYRIAMAGVASAIDLLARRRVIDPQRVGMGGVSFGGEVTMWTAAKSDTLAAMSVSSTLLTPTFYWLSAMPGRDMPAILSSVWGISDPDRSPARWREISPVYAIASIRAPVLMQMPEQEYRYNVELAARLGIAGTPVEMRAFPYEPHIKFQPRHKLAVYRRNLDWFRYWLQGYIDPDPAKKSQYDRWQAFRLKPGWKDNSPPPASGVR